MYTPTFDALSDGRFQKLVLCNDTNSGLRAVIAIHSTALGPAAGGVRFWPYPDESAAIVDAMRRARAMTYKYAIAGIDLGGGAAVVIGNPRTGKSEALLRAFGRFVEQQSGEYLCGSDLGTTLDDMEIIHQETDHIVTLPRHAGGAGDISAATAHGAVAATRACAKRVWGEPSLAGRRIAVQGVGAVGAKAAKLLVDADAEVVIADVDPGKVDRLTSELAVESVAPDDIYGLDVDIFAPYALGGVINDDTIAQLRATIVAGAATDIFAAPRHGAELEARGITYAVDYVANGGGTIFDTDRYRKGGFHPERAWTNVEKIYERTLAVFRRADERGVPYYVAADQIAEQRVEALTRLRTRYWQASRSRTGIEQWEAEA